MCARVCVCVLALQVEDIPWSSHTSFLFWHLTTDIWHLYEQQANEHRKGQLRMDDVETVSTTVDIFTTAVNRCAQLTSRSIFSTSLCIIRTGGSSEWLRSQDMSVYWSTSQWLQMASRLFCELTSATCSHPLCDVLDFDIIHSSVNPVCHTVHIHTTPLVVLYIYMYIPHHNLLCKNRPETGLPV